MKTDGGGPTRIDAEISPMREWVIMLGLVVLLMAAMSGAIGWFVSDAGAVLGPLAY
jgi:hypothetical protein